MKVKFPEGSHCALVTGAAGGIGFNFCRELLRGGCAVIMADIDAERLDEARGKLLSEFPDASVMIFSIDLTSPDVVEKTDAFCAKTAVIPDILINNAGIFSFLPVADTSEKKTECFLNLHVRAVTLLSQWFVRKRTAFRSGWLLNMSSMSCWMPMPGIALYASTKAYIRVFTRSLHYEVRDSGISVTAACPGGIATDLFGLPENLKKLAVGIGALDTPDRLARKALRAMFRRKKQYINGVLNRLSILFVATLPTPVRMQIKHRLLDRGIIRP